MRKLPSPKVVEVKREGRVAHKRPWTFARGSNLPIEKTQMKVKKKGGKKNNRD